MAETITLAREREDETELETTTYEAVQALLNVQPNDAISLFYRLARKLYEAQPEATLREDGHLLCPNGHDVNADEGYASRGISLQTEWEYPDVAVDGVVKTEPSDQWNQGSGTLLYFECDECDTAFRVPDALELKRGEA